MVDTICIINNMEITKDTLKKIREIRKKKGLSSDKLGELIGLSGPAIRHIETGKRKLKLETLEKIAQALGVSVSELLTTPEEKKEKAEEVLEKITDVSLLPIYESVPAGDIKGVQPSLIGYLPTPNQVIRGYPKEQLFWVQVEGDSMSPEIEPGELVLVVDGSYADIRNGDRVIAIYDGEMTLKKFYDKGDYILLQPINEDYEPVLIKKEELSHTPLKLYKVLSVLKRY